MSVALRERIDLLQQSGGAGLSAAVDQPAMRRRAIAIFDPEAIAVSRRQHPDVEECAVASPRRRAWPPGGGGRSERRTADDVAALAGDRSNRRRRRRRRLPRSVGRRRVRPASCRSRLQNFDDARGDFQETARKAPLRPAVDAMRGKLALEARISPPIDVTRELPSGRGNRKRLARPIHAREHRRVTEHAVADFAGELLVILRIGATKANAATARRGSPAPTRARRDRRGRRTCPRTASPLPSGRRRRACPGPWRALRAGPRANAASRRAATFARRRRADRAGPARSRPSLPRESRRNPSSNRWRPLSRTMQKPLAPGA